MKLTYFSPRPVNTQEAAAAYKKLMFAYHPDLHPDNPNATAETQFINAEYAWLLSEFALHGERARQEKAHAEHTCTNADFIDLEDVCDNLRQHIETLLNANLHGLNIEICGLWVWISGETRPASEALKTAGFRRAPKKTMWYYAGTPSRGRGKWDIEDIRAYHGSQRVNLNEKQDDKQDQKHPAYAFAQ